MTPMRISGDPGRGPCRSQPTHGSRLGTASLDPPGQVVAGHVGTWRVVYTVGSYGVDEGGTIKIAQRFVSD